MTCPFCEIVSGQKPVYRIYEDDAVLAFLDLYPYGEGHTLVIPKNHYRWIWDIPAIDTFFAKARLVSTHLARVMNVSTCYSFILGEQVPHAHLHLLPATPATHASVPGVLVPLRQPKLTPKTAEKLLKKLTLPAQ